MTLNTLTNCWFLHFKKKDVFHGHASRMKGLYSMSNLGTLDTENTHKDGLNKSVRRISHAPQNTNKNQDHQTRMQCNTDLCSVFSKIMFTSSVRTGFDLQGAAEF